MKVIFFKLCAFTSSVRPQHVRDTYSQRIGQTACGAIATSISAATTTLVQRNTILSHHWTTRVDVTSVTHYSLHTQQNRTSKKNPSNSHNDFCRVIREIALSFRVLFF